MMGNQFEDFEDVNYLDLDLDLDFGLVAVDGCGVVVDEVEVDVDAEVVAVVVEVVVDVEAVGVVAAVESGHCDGIGSEVNEVLGEVVKEEVKIDSRALCLREMRKNESS